MAVDPQGNDIERFLQEDPGGPLVMMNLVKFKEGGRASFAEYANAVMPFMLKAGAQPLYAGDCSTPLVAEPGQTWDAVMLVRYPSRTAFMQMVSDPEYQRFNHLRTAALNEAVMLATLPWAASP
ncbi:DUF1330 domain-containing protein [Myxococcus sp. K38C18041901]|uniref:DUF1330 domain-containing protein n=1 Tax=Myxococcus guangdongensis TaxID=2906760 RepID=UPI0020A785D7|nr:DUF1330 domain-containing protein [Myxococcus guangdongensis]MCP3060319.1 DUF1330 domain-containing protein [Myxococcus guangdongensis]